MLQGSHPPEDNSIFRGGGSLFPQIQLEDKVNLVEMKDKKELAL